MLERLKIWTVKSHKIIHRIHVIEGHSPWQKNIFCNFNLGKTSLLYSSKNKAEMGIPSHPTLSKV